ncbi:hypothetical protein DUI87_15224 [Hirundo rustica rustica]|uniref:Condensin complex subunit 1 C-terminal domain-containing protein n=1 Tax=Hirundo rustica rustica TaxID=333673 RepID=A0A3M0K3C0_HIRRU|nr:hypothetical protein DUI87_15224 [Hirundo rustica rustica]
MHDSVIGGAKAGVRWTSAFVTTSLEATGGACNWQKEQMRAAIVHACCQQAVEKLQEAAEQQAVSLISSQFPESCSRLPFTMLEKSPLPDVRSGLIVAAGDLAIRLWDLPVPWTSPLCARLQDPCPSVRQTAGPVLTHVPLQDTVTGKGQASDMATVLLEQDEEMVAVPEVFLAELGKRAIGCLGSFSHKRREGLLEAGSIP